MNSRIKQLAVAVVRLFRAEPDIDERHTVPCPVCGYFTLKRGVITAPAYSICPICFWEDELWPDEENDPMAGGGPNHVTLGEARKNYAEFGAVERRLIPHVRKPRPEDACP